MAPARLVTRLALGCVRRFATWARNSAERLRKLRRLVRRASQESSWQLAVTLARALMMLAWTRCSWRCQFLGGERCNSMLAVSIGFTMLRMSFAYTTTRVLTGR